MPSPSSPVRGACVGILIATISACGASRGSTKIRTPLVANAATTATILKGAQSIGCTPSGPDELVGITIDCPDGARIVFGHDSGSDMRMGQVGEPYPIEVMCFGPAANSCQRTVDRILQEGRK